MRIRILGAAAGGGLPQWNCRCPNCLLARPGVSARSGAGSVSPRTQSSLAVSGDGASWFLLNVSPDIRQQFAAFPALYGAGDSPRGSAIAGCLLTDAEIDHTTGLLLLREGTAIPIYSTALVRDWLDRYYPILPILSSFVPRTWHALTLGQPTALDARLEVTAFPLDAHPPRFVTETPNDLAESVVGLIIRDQQSGGTMVYAPGVAKVTPALESAVAGADAIFLDGTFWTEDEMIRRGLSDRYAADMGHMPVSGESGSLAWFSGLGAAHKVYVHINNTNPMLDTSRAEYAEVTRKGVRIGEDGDEFEV